MDLKREPLTFHSKALNRIVAIDELADLSDQDLHAFNGELVVAARSMENALSDAFKREIDTGVPLEYDWVHRVRRKLGICMGFRANITQLLKQPRKVEQQTLSIDDPSVRELIDTKFEELLIDEIGERLYKELQAEAVELVLEGLQQQTPVA